MKIERSRVPLGFAAAALAIGLGAALLPTYGFFIDELYYVVCSQRLAWGYVDHPPLAPALLALSRWLFGETRLALRLPPALAWAATVWLTGRLAGRLGGGPRAQALACAAVLVAPAYQVLFGFFSMNAFEILIWTALTAILVEIEISGCERLWLLFGTVAGLGLLNKHTVVVYAAGLAIAILATRARRHLASPWLWAGLAVALLCALPNLLWQVANGWPSLEFYRNADVLKNVATPPWSVFLLQVQFLNPVTLPIWAAGAWWLLRRPEAERVRHLGVLFAVLFVALLALQKSRPDRIAGIYTLVFAAGGLFWEPILSTRPRRLFAFGALALVGLLFAPLGLPLLPPSLLPAYSRALGAPQQLEAGDGKRTELPQWFADRLGWPQLVEDVAGVFDSLPAADRARAGLIVPSYGQGGALDWLGRDRGLPRAHSTHNNYFLWGPPPDPVEVAIVVGFDERTLREWFERVELAAIHDCDGCMPWRDRMPIWIGRGAKLRIADHWADWKHFE